MHLQVTCTPSNQLTEDEISSWYDLCAESVTYQREFFENLLRNSDYAYLGRDANGNLKGVTAISFSLIRAESRWCCIIKTNLVCVSKEYRGGSFIRKVGWSSYKKACLLFPRLAKYWGSVMLSPTPYMMMVKTFSEVYPNPERKMPKVEQCLINFLSNLRFRARYKDGVFNGESLQKTERIDLRSNADSLSSKAFQYFTQRNPHYDKGHALICLVPINLKNIYSLIRRGISK